MGRHDRAHELIQGKPKEGVEAYQPVANSFCALCSPQF